MSIFFSSEGNPEIWDEKPENYFTVEQWQDAHPTPTPPPPTADELFERLRTERDSRISAVLWMRERHNDEIALGNETTLTPEQYTALLAYIQALRNLPAQPGAPWDGGGELTPWPIKPV